METEGVNAMPVLQEHCAVYVDRLLLVQGIPCALKSVPMLYPKPEKQLLQTVLICYAHCVILVVFQLPSPDTALYTT